MEEKIKELINIHFDLSDVSFASDGEAIDLADGDKDYIASESEVAKFIKKVTTLIESEKQKATIEALEDVRNRIASSDDNPLIQIDIKIQETRIDC